jgi:chromosome segregation protein
MGELKLQLNSVKERLDIEFGIAIEEVLDREPGMPDLGRQELEHKVEKLRRRLDNYGEINPMAVQAYDEMKTRHDFITEQRQDLLDAKTSLMETIAEIDETARTQLMSAYDQVRVNFKEVFQQLFRPEDECDLVLQDPDNPLESRIDIMAKPKGKRPQVIDQLSGGEKTLTAMALLFGLYLLKPAPFCILDEVDAPLDDANINKYNDMIRRFSDRSQFILVTHNKRTMARVDTIYGVTMQEAGVSKVVAVDFRKLEDVVEA